jgi:uncharacterized protein YaiI (UPF0178 family)
VRIWIDADACPRPVKEIIFRAAERTQTPVSLVANKAMHVPSSELVSMVHVPGGPDVADDKIVESADAGDIAITADIPLAARLVEKAIVVLSPHGEEYDEENVRERLSVRDFLSDLRDTGVITGGRGAFNEKDKREFANALDRALSRAKRG